jgi:adenosyl cobinamide kinase/adenosyl cobinamide phosphate guanylyltransferase
MSTGDNIDAKLQQQVEEHINQNTKMWKEIHACIRTNDLKQLMTLLSKHAVNLNSFNVYPFFTVLQSQTVCR